jgi:peptidoglycan/LPS O-acetylase OafA/YrhL
VSDQQYAQFRALKAHGLAQHEDMGNFQLSTDEVRRAKPHFIALDGMRGIAAICVVIFHWLTSNHIEWFGTSVLAVDFFFVLSGFVIAYSYTTKLSQGLNFGEFMLSRIIRLYPMILVGLCLGLVRSIGKSITGDDGVTFGRVLIEFLLSVFMIPNQLIGSVEFFEINIPMWSLLFEMIAYFAFGLFMWRLKDKWLFLLWAIFLGGFAVYMSRSFASGEIFVEPDITIGNLRIAVDMAITPAARAAMGFTLGIIIYRTSLGSKLSLPPFLFLALLFVLLMSMPRNVAPFYVYAVAFIMLTLALMSKGTRTEVRGGLKAIFKFLGDISFPLYAIHMPILGVLGYIIKTLFSSTGIPLVYFGLLIVPFTIFASYLAFRVIDVPTRKWLTRVATDKGWVSPR